MLKWLVFILYLSVKPLSLCHCQKLVYYCNFDNGSIDDCALRINESTKTLTFTIVSGVISNSLKTPQPLSDVTSIQSLTIPNNETCILPYLTDEHVEMYFCKRNTETNFTCPTASGIGNCIIGNYALFQTNASTHDETYLTNINIEPNTIYCVNFFYYMTNSFDGKKITVGWKSNDTTKAIVEIASSSENKWQQSQTTFISPELKLDQIWFRMTSNTELFGTFIYAIDEIKIFEGPCDSTLSQMESFSSLVQLEIYDDETDDTLTEFTFLGNTTVPGTITDIDTTTTTDTTESTTPVETTEAMNVTTAYTSDANTTTYTVEPYSSTKSSARERELHLITLTVPLGMGVPAVLIVIGGLFYHYRKAQRRRRQRVSSDSINPFGIEMTETDA